MTSALFIQGKRKGWWHHAEHFLEAVEACADADKPPTRQASLVRAMLGRRTEFNPERDDIQLPNDPFILLKSVRRAFAFECSSFLFGQSVERERWLPYVAWAKGLRETDTVVTFNYDNIPEMLANAGGKLSVIQPSNGTTWDQAACSELRKKAAEDGKACVLKLHGSVTWSQDENECFLDIQDPVFGIGDPLIGVPGHAKLGLSQKLHPLWNAADEALRNAAGITFIGYRFPESDTYAKNKILTALRYNDQRHHLQIVLGPDVNSPDVRRAIALLDTEGSARVTAYPLFAEDFLELAHLPW